MADDWYSGAENLMNVLLLGEAYVDEADPILSFNTYWDIEDYWDFGFVQVSTDTGDQHGHRLRIHTQHTTMRQALTPTSSQTFQD